MFRIDDDVPMPKARGGATKYPLVDMEVGQSFLVPPEDGESLRRLAHARGKELGRKYTTRQVEGGVRVWRVA